MSDRKPKASKTSISTAASPGYPAIRHRRNRKAHWSRRMVAEHTLSPADFIWPIFVLEGSAKREPVASMPGVERLSIDQVVEAAHEAAKLGIPVCNTPDYGTSEVADHDPDIPGATA